MPQRDQLFEWRTIRDNVTLGLAIRHELTPERLARVDTLLARYGLAEFAAKRRRSSPAVCASAAR